MLAAWLNDNGVAHIDHVTVHRARLAPGWVTARRYAILTFNQLCRPTQPGRPYVGRHRVLVIVTTTVVEEMMGSA